VRCSVSFACLRVFCLLLRRDNRVRREAAGSQRPTRLAPEGESSPCTPFTFRRRRTGWDGLIVLIENLQVFRRDHAAHGRRKTGFCSMM
jgi:hypothetical protein